MSNIRYLTSDTRLTKRGSEVTLIKGPDISGVCIIHNGKEMHSCRVEILSQVPVVDVIIQVFEEPNLFNII